MVKTKNILFVCKFNRFRSRVAEAYFKKINKNKNINVESAGLIKGRPINKLQKNISKKFGININGTPQGLSTKLLIWQNILVITANNVPKNIFKENKKYNKKTIIWRIPDETKGDKKEIEKIIKKIMKKVENLNKKLEKEK